MAKKTLSDLLDQDNRSALEIITDLASRGITIENALSGNFDLNTLTAAKRDLLERVVLGSPLYKGFRDEIAPYFGKEKAHELIDRLAELIYDSLANESRDEVEVGWIKSYLLNLGFLRQKRSSHRASLDFVTKYPALFSDERDVVEAMIDRYVHDTIAQTPIAETRHVLADLRVEISKYKEILEESWEE